MLSWYRTETVIKGVKYVDYKQSINIHVVKLGLMNKYGVRLSKKSKVERVNDDMKKFFVSGYVTEQTKINETGIYLNREHALVEKIKEYGKIAKALTYLELNGKDALYRTTIAEDGL